MKLERKTRVAIAFVVVLVLTLLANVIIVDNIKVIETPFGKWVLVALWLAYAIFGYRMFRQKK